MSPYRIVKKKFKFVVLFILILVAISVATFFLPSLEIKKQLIPMEQLVVFVDKNNGSINEIIYYISLNISDPDAVHRPIPLKQTYSSDTIANRSIPTEDEAIAVAESDPTVQNFYNRIRKYYSFHTNQPYVGIKTYYWEEGILFDKERSNIWVVSITYIPTGHEIIKNL